ncbi:hypothetical protein VNO78_28547 [Psophocarpus tetragonolobus]|uniref:Protein transport protein SEC23 n=1 Tax=Psophocarpus tetragonolobus TaxID=3891 RepID=A0AAN9S4L8_PSOTE
MDLVELEAVEGLRWTWNSWPAEGSNMIIPLSIMCTPLMLKKEVPLLPYEALQCGGCDAVLNPYARLDYQSRIWHCPFCFLRNPFPRPIADTNLPAELFPTYSTVEYCPTQSHYPPAFVFLVDLSTPQDELRPLKNQLLLLLHHHLPDHALVALITFDSMVYLHHLAYSHCSSLHLFHGNRNLSSDRIRNLLTNTHGHGHPFLLPVSECQLSITAAIEEINSTSNPTPTPTTRPPRCTGSAISVALGLLESCLLNTGSRIMLFTSGPATLGPGIVVDSDLRHPIRTHHHIFTSQARHHAKSSSFYNHLSSRLSASSVVLDLFACSLDQVGAAELRLPVERSGGFMILSDSFHSDPFKKCLSHLFTSDLQNMNFDATIEIVTTKDVKISGALGPCVSLHRKNNNKNGLVTEAQVGEGGTSLWKLNTLTPKTCIAFFFQVNQEQNIQPGSAFLIQFITRYRQGNMGGHRKRVTTAARRWVAKHSADIAAGFDQEAAAAVMARLAILRAETCHARDVVRWLDDTLVRFTSKFGDYVPEDPSSFRLSSNFSLYPQFMFHLRRSQFIDVSNTTPDETAFFRLVLNREGVVGSLIMIQPTLFQYSFDGPPVPVLLDIRSISPDFILLFDSFFYVVIHYGSKIAQWKKLGYDKDPNHDNFRKLLEAPELDAEQLVADRVPVPRIITCDQHSSQARFLLAKLNPSVTQNSTYTDGSDIIFTDDLSLEVFLDQLQVLAVQS